MTTATEKELNEHGIPTAESFSITVEQRVKAEGDEGSYIEQTAQALEELGIDAKDGLKLISPALKDKIQREAEERNMLKVKNTTTRLF